MNKMKCGYISKSNIKKRKEVINNVMPEVIKDVKKEYKKAFNYMMVGSARRNLVVKNGKSLWDLDYQFILTSPKFDNADPAELKNYIKNSLQKRLPNDYSVNLSTSVITIIKKNSNGSHAEESIDIAILKTNPRTKNKEILRGKSDNKKDLNYIKWEELKDSKNISDKLKKIKGQDDWNLFREQFLNKKCKESKKPKDQQKSTSSIYIETVNEFKKYIYITKPTKP